MLQDRDSLPYAINFFAVKSPLLRSSVSFRAGALARVAYYGATNVLNRMQRSLKLGQRYFTKMELASDWLATLV